MNILISNDDGVMAPGLIALASALKQIAQVTVVAPETERSGSSSALTLDRPLRATEVSSGVWSVNGTPADCVYLAMNGLFIDQKFDLLVTGINSGHNLGDHILYSGTVGAALEGRALALPSLAISLVGKNVRAYQSPQDYLVAATWVKQFIEKGLPTIARGHLLNINIPDVSELAGALYTYQGKSIRLNPLLQDKDPHGRQVNWISLASKASDHINTQNTETCSDFDAIAANFVSITPLAADRTQYALLSELQSSKHL